MYKGFRPTNSDFARWPLAPEWSTLHVHVAGARELVEMKETLYGYHRMLPGVGYEEAVRTTTAALEAEGFGVLTTIDVQAAFKKKLGIDYRRYVILGACNPGLAHQALEAEESIGLLLPCNVVVAEIDGGAEVAILRPTSMSSLVNHPRIDPVMKEADQKLRRVLRHWDGQSDS